MKKKITYAIDIQWDVDEEEDFKDLPQKIEIPNSIAKKGDDAISDYISDATGFCHAGFRLITKIIDVPTQKKRQLNYYDVNYRLETTSVFTVIAGSKSEARIIAEQMLNDMPKYELIDRFLAALDFEPNLVIKNVSFADVCEDYEEEK